MAERYPRSPSAEKNMRSRSRSESLSRSRSRSCSRSWSRPRDISRSRGHGRTETVNPGNNIYVTGLSTRVTERDLEDHFAKEGKVKSVFLVVEPRSRISRGFAFITMDNVEGANRCIKHLNQSVLEGRYITVERSRRKRARTPTPGHYLGLRGDGYRGGSSRDGYGYQRRSPYRGGPDYSPHRRSPYSRRSRRSRSRSYSPRRSQERNYARGSR